MDIFNLHQEQDDLLRECPHALRSEEDFSSLAPASPVLGGLREKKEEDAFIAKMAALYGSPTMLIDRSILRRQTRVFSSCFPGVEIFVSMKANPHPEILKIYFQEGLKVDCASLPEIELALKSGAKPEDILFAHPVKRIEDIQGAKAFGVDLMTFDNIYEIQKMAEYHPGARVILRVRVDNSNAQVALSLKFGAEPSDAEMLMDEARKAGLNVVGVSFHVGSQCTNPDTFLEAVRMGAGLMRQAVANGHPATILDIGGGFPIRHFDTDTHADIYALAAVLRPEIQKIRAEGFRVIAEPGRYMVGESATLITKIIGKSTRMGRRFYYLDDGVYQDLSGVVFDRCRYQIRSLKSGPLHESVLAGPTCDSFDMVTIDEQLPELEINDLLYVCNIGAYSMASSSIGFNGFRPAKVVLY